MDSQLFRDARRRYRVLSAWERFHLWGRFRACPWRAFIGLLPQGRRLLDIGCGHGLFINLARAAGCGYEQYRGLDHDQRKIAVARQTVDDRVSFEARPVDPAADEGFDVCSIIDVLYLLPYAAKERLLAGIHALLPQGGTLFLKELDTVPRWKYALTRAEEVVATRLARFTRGAGLFFESRDDAAARLRCLGFSVEIHDLQRGYPHAHVLFRCVK